MVENATSEQIVAPEAEGAKVTPNSAQTKEDKSTDSENLDRVLILSTSFFLLFSVFNTLSNIASSVLE